MHNIWSRLRNDAQLAIITCAGLLGLVSLSPFAFYRWVQGDLAMVVIDSLLTLFTAFALYVSWFHNKAALAGQILGVLYAAGNHSCSCSRKAACTGSAAPSVHFFICRRCAAPSLWPHWRCCAAMAAVCRGVHDAQHLILLPPPVWSARARLHVRLYHATAPAAATGQ